MYAVVLSYLDWWISIPFNCPWQGAKRICNLVNPTLSFLQTLSQDLMLLVSVFSINSSITCVLQYWRIYSLILLFHRDSVVGQVVTIKSLFWYLVVIQLPNPAASFQESTLFLHYCSTLFLLAFFFTLAINVIISRLTSIGI